jgi:catechol 2,3-dioxygenase-like lactoylglutathione lyase family enzyme
MRRPFIDHITIEVSDYEASRRFYERALAPFGINIKDITSPDSGKPEAELGPPGCEDFCITPGEPSRPVHIAFLAPDHATVDAFHEAGLAAGGTDNGAPGVRPKYSNRYYAAYVLDPDGNNVEAVCHDPAPA